MLTISSLEHSFGGLRAIAGFDLTVIRRGVYGIIGPNGAGKTTLFNLITGLYRPTTGTIAFDGENIAGRKPHDIARLGIARTFQNLRLFSDLTVAENIRAGQIYQYDCLNLREKLTSGKALFREQQRKAARLMELVGISHRAGEKAGNLPYGMQRKLEIARALATEPKMLLLDEPAAGMNPKEVMSLVEVIDNARREYDLTILLIEHQMRLVEALCEHVTVMSFGQVIANGTAAEVQNNELVIKAYLGEGEVE